MLELGSGLGSRVIEVCMCVGVCKRTLCKYAVKNRADVNHPPPSRESHEYFILAALLTGACAHSLNVTLPRSLAFITSNRTDVQPKPKTHEVMPSEDQGPPVKRGQSTSDLRARLLAAGSNHLDSYLLRQGSWWGGGNSTSTVAPERACLQGKRSRFKGMIARHHISFLLVQ